MDSDYNEKSAPESVLRDYYENHYERVFCSGLQSRGTKYFHKRLESKWSSNSPERVLELGAGSGEHFYFVRDDKNTIKEYYALDLMDGSGSKFTSASSLPVSWVQANAQDLPFSDGSIDRVVVTCLLHHLDNPYQCLNEINRVLKIGGEFAIAMPTDPGMLNRLIKKVISKPAMRRSGIENPDLIYALEHRNHIKGLLVLLSYRFEKDVNFYYLPFRVRSWNLNVMVLAKGKKVR
jgi:ubiquinone/menaquinone biosynthesis C-methylase UbiE